MGTLAFTTTQIPAPNGPYALAAADFNCDHHKDIVFNEVTNARMSSEGNFAYGNGDGTFQATYVYPGGNLSTTPIPATLSVADFDGDGTSDVMMTSGQGGLLVYAMLSNGDGTFHNGIEQEFTSNPFFIDNISPTSSVTGIFSEDGTADIVISSANSINEGQITIMQRKPGGGFTNPFTYYIELPDAEGVAMGDFNGDGHLDVVTANLSSNVGSFSLLEGDGKGTFAKPLSTGNVGSPGPYGIASGDFNGDHHLDVAYGLSTNKGNRIAVALGNGDGTFAADTLSPSSVVAGLAMVSADMNNDGILDVVYVTYNSTLTGYDVAVMLGKGDGTFGVANQYPGSLAISGTTPSPQSLAVADFNEDGNLDIVFANPGAATVSVLTRTGCTPLGRDIPR